MLAFLSMVGAVSIILMLIIIEKSKELHLVAIPNERSSHVLPTPSGGGIAFMLAFFIGVFVSDYSVYFEYKLTVMSMVIIYFLGIYDDVMPTSSKVKFSFIILSSVLVSFDGLQILTFGNYFNYDFSVGYLAVPITIVAIVGFTNALNLVDGLDGLATLVSLVILSGLGIIGYQYEDTFIINISSILMISLLTFIIFNWNPAKIFMGDSGSLSLGFIIAVVSIKATEYIDPVSILYIAALPILDTVTVMTRRKMNGLSMVQPDRNHIHHVLKEKLGGNVKLTVICLSIVQVVFTVIGVFITPLLGQEVTLPLFFVCLMAFYFFVERLSGRELMASTSGS